MSAEWLAAMRRGDFEAAWRISDALLHAPHDSTLPRHFQRVWTGEPLDGKRVLIRCYHGLGDTIQFLRYVPLVKEIAKDVTLWIQPSLIPLVPFDVEMLPLHDGVPEVEYDVDVEIMELAHVFRRVVSDVPYLHAEPLPDVRGGVGFAWRSGDWDPARDVPFVRLPGVTHNLQRGAEAPGLVSLEERNDPLGTARLMRALDLVVTVDTFTAHLAGALGVETWTLLQASADWRWMEERTDSPWYPTMRLFRQQRAGDWEPVLAQVTELLLQRRGVERQRPDDVGGIRRSGGEESLLGLDHDGEPARRSEE